MENGVSRLVHSFLIESSSKLLVTRTGIKARTSSISGLWFPWPICMFSEMRFDLCTLDSNCKMNIRQNIYIFSSSTKTRTKYTIGLNTSFSSFKYDKNDQIPRGRGKEKESKRSTLLQSVINFIDVHFNFFLKGGERKDEMVVT